MQLAEPPLGSADLLGPTCRAGPTMARLKRHHGATPALPGQAWRRTPADLRTGDSMAGGGAHWAQHGGGGHHGLGVKYSSLMLVLPKPNSCRPPPLCARSLETDRSCPTREPKRSLAHAFLRTQRQTPGVTMGRHEWFTAMGARRALASRHEEAIHKDAMGALNPSARGNTCGAARTNTGSVNLVSTSSRGHPIAPLC